MPEMCVWVSPMRLARSLWVQPRFGLQLLANSEVQLASGSIVRRDDESILGRFDVAPGDGADAVFCVGNFLHTALLLECVERSGDLARLQQDQASPELLCSSSTYSLPEFLFPGADL